MITETVLRRKLVIIHVDNDDDFHISHYGDLCAADQDRPYQVHGAACMD